MNRSVVSYSDSNESNSASNYCLELNIVTTGFLSYDETKGDNFKTKETKMNKRYGLTVAMLPLLISAISCTAPEKEMPVALSYKAVTEINEGTIRRVYIDKPLIGAKGYVVGDWANGRARVEVMNFPSSEMGYEAFLFEIDAPAYMAKMFVDGNPEKGIVPEPPPFDEVGGLISQWYSLGDLEMNDMGSGTLEYKKGDDLVAKGLNMIMVFEKVTEGMHEGPEDISKLMVECNGPVAGFPGAEAMAKAVTIFPKEM